MFLCHPISPLLSWEVTALLMLEYILSVHILMLVLWIYSPTAIWSIVTRFKIIYMMSRYVSIVITHCYHYVLGIVYKSTLFHVDCFIYFDYTMLFQYVNTVQYIHPFPYWCIFPNLCFYKQYNNKCLYTYLILHTHGPGSGIAS